MLTRDDRLVENERAFKLANERLRHVLEDVAEDRPIPFLCECVDAACVGRIELSLSDYARIRSNESWYVIITGHPTLPGEAVVQENDHYQVVEK